MSKRPASLIGSIRAVRIEALTANSLQGRRWFERTLQIPRRARPRPNKSPWNSPTTSCWRRCRGPHQKHFARLEQRLAVRITQRGNLIAIAGTADARGRAAAILRALYARLEAGESITLAEVDAEIRFTDPHRQPRRAAIEGAIRTAGIAHHPAAQPRAERLSRSDARQSPGVRHRPRRHRQDLSRRRLWRAYAAISAGSSG